MAGPARHGASLIASRGRSIGRRRASLRPLKIVLQDVYGFQGILAGFHRIFSPNCWGLRAHARSKAARVAGWKSRARVWNMSWRHGNLFLLSQMLVNLQYSIVAGYNAHAHAHAHTYAQLRGQRLTISS